MLSKRLKLAAAAAILVVASVAGATPAQADTVKCAKNVKKFDLPRKPDVTVTVNLCVLRASADGKMRAYASMKWVGSSFIGGTRFNDFKLNLRLERSDVIKKQITYDVLPGLNQYASGTANFHGVSLNNPPRGGWSADGVLVYDINNDGLGDYTWNLTGSPVIR